LHCSDMVLFAGSISIFYHILQTGSISVFLSLIAHVEECPVNWVDKCP
jgi:hypothetical protein